MFPPTLSSKNTMDMSPRLEILHRCTNLDLLLGVIDKYISYFEIDYIKIDLIPFGQQNGLTAREIAN